MLYDWMGHERNRSKHSTHQSPSTALCQHCGQLDDQSHIMLTCPHPLLLPIRHTAKDRQFPLATSLKKKLHQPHLHYFIEQLTVASWTTPSVHTRRIWLGMWSPTTLQSLLPPDITLSTPMTTPERYQYRLIVSTLTTPLIDAYTLMIRLQLPTYRTSHRTDPLAVSLKTTRHMRLLFHNTQYNNTLPSIPAHNMQQSLDTYAYSDAAFSLTDKDIGILHKPVIF
jgi:hypothetical protein